MQRVFLVHFIAELIIGTISIVLTLLLLWIVWSHRTARLKNYSWILIMNGVADLVFAVVNMILMEGVEILNNSLYLFSTSTFYRTSQTVATGTTALWLTALYMSFGVLPVNYYYRYRQLCGRELTIGQYIALYFLVLFYVGAHCFSVYWFTLPSEPHFDEIITNLPFYEDPPVYIVSNAEHIGCIYHLLHSTFQVLGSYALVAYFAMKIRAAVVKASQQRQMSVGAKRADKQIMLVMFVQVKNVIFKVLSKISMVDSEI